MPRIYDRSGGGRFAQMGSTTAEGIAAGLQEAASVAQEQQEMEIQEERRTAFQAQQAMASDLFHRQRAQEESAQRLNASLAEDLNLFDEEQLHDYAGAAPDRQEIMRIEAQDHRARRGRADRLAGMMAQFEGNEELLPILEMASQVVMDQQADPTDISRAWQEAMRQYGYALRQQDTSKMYETVAEIMAQDPTDEFSKQFQQDWKSNLMDLEEAYDRAQIHRETEDLKGQLDRDELLRLRQERLERRRREENRPPPADPMRRESLESGNGRAPTVEPGMPPEQDVYGPPPYQPAPMDLPPFVQEDVPQEEADTRQWQDIGLPEGLTGSELESKMASFRVKVAEAAQFLTEENHDEWVAKIAGELGLPFKTAEELRPWLKFDEASWVRQRQQEIVRKGPIR